MKIIWAINQLQRRTSDGGVITAHWGCVAGERGVSVNHYGSCDFEPDSTAPDFVPFKQLTQDQILGWVYTQIDREAIEADLKARVAERLNPTVVNGLPWESHVAPIRNTSDFLERIRVVGW